jgi:hypothetical protein
MLAGRVERQGLGDGAVELDFRALDEHAELSGGVLV